MSQYGKLVKEADAWAKAIALKRYGDCCVLSEIKQVTCGGGIQAAHILRKGGHYSSIRWHEENILPICRNHHLFWAHIYEYDFYRWVENTFPGRLDHLRNTAQHRGKVDLKELICVLKSLAK